MSVSKRLRFKILARDGFTCRYCGRSAPSVVLHVDHVHPVSKGGSDDDANLVTSCRDCNASKSDKVLAYVPDSVAKNNEESSPDGSVPHVDRCSKCGGRSLHAAHREVKGKAGYYAFYRCDRGHEWTTFWGSIHRMTPEDAAALIAETNGLLPVEAK